MWWDPVSKENNPLSSDYQYVRYPTCALKAFLKLGLDAEDKAKIDPPEAQTILIITNAGDKSINLDMVDKFLKLWRKKGASVDSYRFPKDLEQPHDMIAPDKPNNNIDLIYPKLLELFGPHS